MNSRAAAEYHGLVAKISLTAAAWVFVGGLVLHNADHARRGLSVTGEGVIWGGTLLLALSAAMLTLVFTRHAIAPMAATVVGGAAAVGVSASHLLPDWGPLSEELAAVGVDGFTWFAVLSEIAGAALLAAVGFSIVRRNGYGWTAESGWA